MPDVVDTVLSRAAAQPDLLAVDSDGICCGYEELRSLSMRTASAIRLVSSTPTPRVLLALSPSAAAYAAMMGSLVAGGTFCPVNVFGPDGRNALIARAFSPDVILFEGKAPNFLDDSPATTPRIDVRQAGSTEPGPLPTEHSEVAYVVFTSGSSGQPKGVKIGRAAFSHFLDVAGPLFELTPAARWGQWSNLGYDLAVMDVFLALSQGGTLVPLASPAEQLFPARAIQEKRIQVWQSVPSVLDLMMKAHQVTPDYLAPLRLMSFCGEPLLPRHLKALFQARPDLIVFNTYGTTETTGFNTINRLTSTDYAQSCETPTVALGDSVPGWTISLRGGDSADEGEIVVSSDFLSLGYWHDEDRTRSAFRQVRHHGGPEARSYFSGDRGIRRNSRVYFTSRMDRQVKVRGERIELDEVDHLLRETGFRAAFTILAENELYSFVESEGDVDQERIRDHLAKRLPFHAVPKAIRPLSALPRSPNGKIDRRALEELALS